MRFCRSRIAWTALWGAVCLWVIALWVRSFRPNTDRAYVCGVFCCSTEGSVLLFHLQSSSSPTVNQLLRTWANSPPSDTVEPQKGVLGFYTQWQLPVWYLQAPHWFLVVFSVGLAGMPGISWRFGLRTLIIGTALVAVVLGIFMWLRE